MPLLVGTDGVEKMSKSKGNYIGISESPDSMFGKLMSISDTLMWRYFELLSFRSLEDIAALKAETEAGRNPRDAKVLLAQEIITRFHSARAAEEALASFEARFRDGAIPDDMPEVNVAGAPVGILKLLREAGLVASGSKPAQRGAGRRAGGRRPRRGQIVAIARRHLRGAGRQAQIRPCYREVVILRRSLDPVAAEI